jgi:hypothetical protein
MFLEIAFRGQTFPEILAILPSLDIMWELFIAQAARWNQGDRAETMSAPSLTFYPKEDAVWDEPAWRQYANDFPTVHVFMLYIKKWHNKGI